jgi:hypothetical protein
MIEVSPPQPLHMATAERASGQGGVTEPVAALPRPGLPGSLLEAGAERALDGHRLVRNEYCLLDWVVFMRSSGVRRRCRLTAGAEGNQALTVAFGGCR